MLSCTRLWILVALIAGLFCHSASIAGKDCRIDDDILQQLLSVDPQEHEAAMQEVVRHPDLDLLPAFREILTRKDSSLRRRITMLVIRAYPDHAFSFFQNCFEPFDLHRQEAATHGIGFLVDSRVTVELEKLLQSTHREIRVAALRSLQMQCRSITMAAFKRVSGSSQGKTTEIALACRQRALKVLERSHQSAPTDPDLIQAWSRWVDSSLASVSRNRWTSSLDQESPMATGSLALFNANKDWLGRVRPSARLDYQFSMVNLFSASTKEITIHSSIEDIETLRAMAYDLDRVIHFRSASDLLFNHPAVLSPRWVDDSEPEISSLSFSISGHPMPHAGIGLLNISYWEGKLQGASRATVRFQRGSGRFIDETVYDEKGRELWKMEVLSWLEGGRLPEKISIDIPAAQVGARKIHLRLDLRFQLAAGQWLLAEGKTYERIQPDEQELRAYCEVELLTDPTPDPDPVDADSSGQGSTAGSPRK
ncbi:MAG: hypothetical protein OSB09_07000 [Planctomycetota bacterium]|nr:hypothetical protein [Planctomycetota bacterium]